MEKNVARRIAWLIPCALLTVAAATEGASHQAAIRFDTRGLASVSYAGTESLADGRPRALEVVFERCRLDQKSGFKQYDFETLHQRPDGRFDPKSRRLTCDFAWGQLTVGYRPLADRLALEVRLTNASRRTIADFSLEALRLRLPEPPSRLLKGQELQTSSLDRLAVLELDLRRFKMLACCDTIYPPIHLVLRRRQGDGFPLAIRGGVWVPEPGAHEIHPHGLPRVAPGKTLAVEFSLRFVGSGASVDSALADLYEKFRAFHTPRLAWKDKRPIGALFLPSNRARRTEGNPRGWFGDQRLDIRTQAGKALFRKRILEFADRSVAVLKEMNAQGMVVWNLEGEEHPQITYVGDPRMVKLLAPEMDEVADEFFQKFRSAGLRTGVCIRPTQVYFNKKTGKWAHGTGSHGPTRNPLGDDFSAIWPRGLPWWRFYPVVERMCRKIAYARKRWGCSLFYVDTNGVFRQVGEDQKFEWMLLDAGVWREILKRHPDVVLIPELDRDNWTVHLAQWAYTAPYRQPPYSSARTPDLVKSLFPEAFSVCYSVNLSPADFEKYRNDLIRGVRSGDILFFRCWFRDRMNEKVRSIYEAARAGK